MGGDIRLLPQGVGDGDQVALGVVVEAGNVGDVVRITISSSLTT